MAQHPPIEPQWHHLDRDENDTTPARMNPRERRLSGPLMIMLLMLGLVIVAIGIYFSTRI